jgi:hypothetical protein
MKKLTLFLSTAFILLSFTAAQAVSNTLKTIDVDQFTGIKINGNYQVYLKQGTTQSVKMEGTDDEIKWISTTVENGIWHIQNKSMNNKNQCNNNYNAYNDAEQPLKIYITMPTLNYLSLNSNGKVMTENTFNVENIDLMLNGSGKMNLNLNANSVESSLCGSGKLVLKGGAKHMENRISGSGYVEAEDFKVENLNVTISGSGDAQVYATGYLKARVSGSGDVYYKGSPSLHQSISGSGSVRKI